MARVGSGKQRVGGVLLAVLAGVGKKPREPREVVRLGQLMHHWRDIVGDQFFKQTAPAKISGGTLFVECATNQWMQTLMFARDVLLGKIQSCVPNAGIKRIEMRLARERHPSWHVDLTPRPVWPDWREHMKKDDRPALPTGPYTAQLEQMRAKMKARVEGLRGEGADTCTCCGMTLVSGKGQTCAVCRHRHTAEREQMLRALLREHPTIPDADICQAIPGIAAGEVRELRSRVRQGRLRQLLADNPWFTNGELQALVRQASPDECEQVRREARHQGEIEIELLLKSRNSDEPDDDNIAAARAEICRAMMLTHGVTPDLLDMGLATWYEKLPRAWRVAFASPSQSSRRNRLTTAVEE